MSRLHHTASGPHAIRNWEEKRMRKANRRNIRWQQALSDLTSDYCLLWGNNSFLWGMLTTWVYQQRGKLTQSLLYVRRETDKSGVWEQRVIPIPVIYWQAAAICPSSPTLCVNEWWLGLRLSRQQRAAEGFRANISLRGQAKEALLHGESDCLDLHAISKMSTKQSFYMKCKWFS